MPSSVGYRHTVYQTIKKFDSLINLIKTNEKWLGRKYILIGILLFYTMFTQAFVLSQYSFICEQYFKCSDT